MNYIDIVNLVFSVITSVFGLMMLHFLILQFVGIFGKKKFPKAQTQHKYGLIIPARNEEAVIGNLIKSIQKNDYPQDKIEILVVAHNCTDKTAQICRDLGATVYEYNNPNERTMGYAIRHIFECIRADKGVENYDGFFIFNADNILSKDYLTKMNDAFDATHGESIITSYRNSKNFGTNLISGLASMYFISGCVTEARGRAVVNCATHVQGTGYVFNSALVKDGWPYVSLTEDWEFSADQIIKGHNISFCNDAVFYDEQPTTVKVMWRQRVRWSRGHLLACVTRFKDLFKSLFASRKRHPNKGSLYDFLIIYTVPVVLVTLGINLLQIICYLFAPLFGLSIGAALLRWLISFGISVGGYYLLLMLQAILIFLVERHRIKGLNGWQKFLIVLTWPLFIALEFIIDVVALFIRNCPWHVIPHTDTTNFEQLDELHATNKAVKEEKEEQQ